jgi:hypothetical protein
MRPDKSTDTLGDGVRDWRNDEEQWPPNRSVLTNIMGYHTANESPLANMSVNEQRFIALVNPRKAHGMLGCYLSFSA